MPLWCLHANWRGSSYGPTTDQSPPASTSYQLRSKQLVGSHIKHHIMTVKPLRRNIQLICLGLFINNFHQKSWPRGLSLSPPCGDSWLPSASGSAPSEQCVVDGGCCPWMPAVLHLLRDVGFVGALSRSISPENISQPLHRKQPFSRLCGDLIMRHFKSEPSQQRVNMYFEQSFVRICVTHRTCNVIQPGEDVKHAV